MSEYLNVVIPEERGGISPALVALIALAAIVAAGLSVSGQLPRFAVIQTTSMVPTLVPGDVVMITKADPMSIDVGDIIAFNLAAYEVDEQGRPIDMKGIKITVHRVIERKIINGRLYFRTQGDNNPVPDPWLVPASGVLGKAEKVASLGTFGLVLTNPVGRVFVIMIMLSSLVLLGSTIWSYNKGIREDLEHYL